MENNKAKLAQAQILRAGDISVTNLVEMEQKRKRAV